MKKKFQNPSIKIRSVKRIDIIATSFGSTSEKQGYTPNGYSGGFGRGSSWDDDDEEW